MCYGYIKFTKEVFMDIQVTVKLSLELVNRVAQAEPSLSFDEAVEKVLQLGLKELNNSESEQVSEVVKTSETVKETVQKKAKEKTRLNKSLYPTKSLYPKNQKEFENIFDLLTSLAITLKKRKDVPEDMDAWELSDPVGNRAGLYLTCGEWKLDTLRFGQVLRGWFSDYQGDYFQDLLINNDCILEDDE
jgi:hypothetical protein